MDVVFCDDARQPTPWRAGMGPLAALGAVYVPGAKVGRAESAIEAICRTYGFPPDEEFKWHPRKDSWMCQSLVEERRTSFFCDVLNTLGVQHCRTFVVVEDLGFQPAHHSDSHELDLLTLLLERASLRFRDALGAGLVLMDQPSGGKAQENKLLASAIEQWRCPGNYVLAANIAIAPIVTKSHNVRLLQAADLVTSATLAYIAGEHTFSPPVFAHIHPLLCSESGRIGGVGLKLHPDFRYANLYHWLVGNSHFVRFNTAIPYPLRDRCYASGPDAL